MEASGVHEMTFSFSWKIKNFDFGWNDFDGYILSPPFQVNKGDPTYWRLKLFPNSSVHHFACMLVKDQVQTSSSEVRYDLTFHSDKESTLNSIDIGDVVVSSVSNCVPLTVYSGAVFGTNTLTIQCRIWSSEGMILDRRQCFAESEIEVQRYSDVILVEGFSRMEEGRPFFSLFSYSETLCCRFKMSLNKGMCVIEIQLPEAKITTFCRCQFFILDNESKIIKCGSCGFLSNEERKIQLYLTQADLLKYKNKYLPDDVLSLKYLFEIPTGGILETISYLNLPENADDVSNDISSNSEENNAVPTNPWKDDLSLFYNNGTLCDTVLKTSSEIFPVHSLVLRMRSPVFCDKLPVDECECLKKGLHIEDLDTNTVRKMVLYLYTDILDDLDWERAKDLYCASHKYEITSLDQICASFLKKNLAVNNCCEILCVASRYQDNDLLSVVQCFISNYDKEVLNSDAWMNLEENYPLLACKTLRKLHLKNWEK